METNHPLVSVVIPVYKVEKYLQASVESVLAQTYENIEIILIDDGSPDLCPQICDEIAEKYSNVFAYHKQNGGLSDARNFGIEKSKGKYIFFLDSDDTIDKKTIFSMVELAEAENADIVIPDRYYQSYEEDGRTELLYHFKEEGLYIQNPLMFALEVLIARGRAWRATAVLYHLDVIKREKCLFPVGYTAEDISFNLQVMSHARKIAFLRTPTLNYLKRKNSITTSFNKNLFQTLLYIDTVVQEFLEKNQIATDKNKQKRDSLLSRNVIVHMIVGFNPKYGLTPKEKKSLFEEIVKNPRVEQSMKTKMIRPYFNSKMLSIAILMIHNLIKIRCNWMAVAVVKAINALR